MNISKNKIQTWSITRLTPYAKNSRTHSDEQVQKIAASITTYGFTNPILVDENYGILAGHGRLAASKLLKLEEVPVIILTGLTEAQKRAYVIADNKLAEDAGWDAEVLAGELAYLHDNDLLDASGFSPEEFNEIFNDLDNDFNTKPTKISAANFDYMTAEVPEALPNETKTVGTSKIIATLVAKDAATITAEKATLVFADTDTTSVSDIMTALHTLNTGTTSFYIRYTAKSAAELFNTLKKNKCNISTTFLVTHADAGTADTDYFRNDYSALAYGWFSGQGAHSFFGSRTHHSHLDAPKATSIDCPEVYEYFLKRNTKIGDTVVNLATQSPAFALACKKLHRFGVSACDPKKYHSILNTLEGLAN